MKYFKQLDALRCYAVFWVVFAHLPLMNLHPVFKNFFDYIPGVQLFFCISGFLITRIVLENYHFKPKHFFKSFYVRRFLRIFPIYYLVIFCLFVFNPEGYRTTWFVYDFFYVSNIKLGFQGSFDANVVSPHFWSLAVEEQFYLLWPGLIFFTKGKLQAFFLGATFFLIGILFMVFSGSFLVLRTVGCLSYLGSGCLLAITYYYHPALLIKGKTIINIIFSMVLLALLFICLGRFHPTPEANILLTIIAIPLIVLKFILGFESKYIAVVLENPVIIYLGKISYGIYVYHMFALYPLLAVQKLLGFSIYNPFLIALIKIAIAVGISIVSWEFFEKNMNKLKNKFSYS